MKGLKLMGTINNRFDATAILIITTGIVTRFLLLDKVPIGFHFDEARNGLDAVKILTGTYKTLIFQPILPGTIDSAKEALFSNLLALAISIGKKDILTLRTTSAVISSISIPLFFYMSYLFFDKDYKKTLIASTVFTFSSWNLIISRLIFRVNLVIPILITSVIFVLLASKKHKRASLYSLCFGGINALGLYTYNSYTLLFLFLYMWLWYNLKNKKLLIVSLFASFIILTPLVTHLKTGGGFNGYVNRANELSIFSPVWTHNSEREIAKSFAKNVFLDTQMFFFYGDKNRRHNAYSLPALDFPINIFAFASLLIIAKRGISIFRASNPKIRILAGGIIISLIPAILTYQGNPHFLRAFSALVFISLLVPQLLLEIIKRDKIIVAILATFITFSLFKVFYLWGTKNTLVEVFGDSEYAIGTYIKQNANLKVDKVYILDTGIKKLPIEYLTYGNTNIAYLDRILLEDKLKHILQSDEYVFVPLNSYQVKYFKDTLYETPNNKKRINKLAPFLIVYNKPHGTEMH